MAKSPTRRPSHSSSPLSQGDRSHSVHFVDKQTEDRDPRQKRSERRDLWVHTRLLAAPPLPKVTQAPLLSCSFQPLFFPLLTVVIFESQFCFSLYPYLSVSASLSPNLCLSDPKGFCNLSPPPHLPLFPFHSQITLFLNLIRSNWPQSFLPRKPFCGFLQVTPPSLGDSQWQEPCFSQRGSSSPNSIHSGSSEKAFPLSCSSHLVSAREAGDCT